MDIIGPRPDLLTIAGNPGADDKFHIFDFGFGVNILVSGMTIRDGRTRMETDSGAGIHANGINSLTISNCSLVNNIAGDNGGAILASGIPTIAIYDTYFGGNEAGEGAAPSICPAVKPETR